MAYGICSFFIPPPGRITSRVIHVVRCLFGLLPFRFEGRFVGENGLQIWTQRLEFSECKCYDEYQTPRCIPRAHISAWGKGQQNEVTLPFSASLVTCDQSIRNYDLADNFEKWRLFSISHFCNSGDGHSCRKDPSPLSIGRPEWSKMEPVVNNFSSQRRMYACIWDQVFRGCICHGLNFVPAA